MKKFMFFAMSVFIMAACSSDNENNGNASNGNPNGNTDSQGRVVLQISGGIDVDVASQARTRAANSAWEANDQIGVYAVGTGGTTAITGGSNVSYSFNDTGNEETNGSYYRSFIASSTPVYLPANGDAVDIYAYYPYSNSASTPTAIPINVATQTTQKSIDFMRAAATTTTATGSTAISKANPSCQLLFAHKLVKLQFNIKGASGVGSVASTLSAVTIGGQPTAATYNIYSDAINITTASTTISAVAMGSPATSYDVSYEAIVLPNGTNNTAADRTITLTNNGVDYTFTIGSGISFTAGYKYTYNVTVNASDLEITAAITDWTDGGSTNVNVQ